MQPATMLLATTKNNTPTIYTLIHHDYYDDHILPMVVASISWEQLNNINECYRLYIFMCDIYVYMYIYVHTSKYH